MEFISMKQTPFNTAKTTLALISFTVFLTILVLGSCGLKRINSPDTSNPQTAFQKDVETTTTVPNLATANALTREVLEPLGASAGATLEKRYVTESGAGSYNGTSWANAWAATNLRNGITNINNASASRVYLVMVAGGTYKPTYTTSRSDSFSMKNYVAIMGGFQTGGGWGRTGTTIFSGDIGTVGTTTDNSYNVFSHTSLTLDNAHLHGVIITNGNASGGTFPLAHGGGMVNNASSPRLTRVVFSGNTANHGGGLYNNASAPVLTRVVFSRNTAQNGGGLYNNSSSPVLTTVVFNRNNVTSSGGGMVNTSRAVPVLTGVVFSENSAIINGGGMYNTQSSPVMIGSVFRNNRAADGGAMWNDNGSGEAGPLIVNTIFSGNTLSGTGSGPDIAVNQGGFNVGAETIRIAGSVLGLGQSSAIAGIVGFGGTTAINISNHSLANGLVTFGADANLTINGMNFPYPTITSGSAVNLGLFVRKHVNASTSTYYFSETEAIISWHTGFTSAGGLDGTAGYLPTTGTIEDLTATDLAGNARSGRPDAGVDEVP